eukprot:875291-Prorocentrum_minimum.AAC.2
MDMRGSQHWKIVLRRWCPPHCTTRYMHTTLNRQVAAIFILNDFDWMSLTCQLLFGNGTNLIPLAQELSDILVAIGRYSALERQYTTARLRPLMEVWEQYDTATGSNASFVAWLPSFYDSILLQFRQESRWYGCLL